MKTVVDFAYIDWELEKNAGVCCVSKYSKCELYPSHLSQVYDPMTI